MGNPLWFIIWLLILVFISFWVAGLGCFFYVVLYMLESCISALKPINEMLLQCIQFPNFCAKGMMECKPLF